MGLHHKVEVPTMIATKPIVKHSGPGAYRPRTPSLYAFDEDGSYGLDATPYPYGDDDRSYGSLEASGPADPWTQTDPALPRRGPQQKVVRRGGALPLGAITVDVRKGGRAVTRVVPEREIVLAAFRTSAPLGQRSSVQMSFEEPRSMSSVTSFEDRSQLRTRSPTKSVRVPSPSVYPTANVESLGGSGDRRATDRRIMTADRAVRTSIQESDAPASAEVYLPLPGGGAGGGGMTPEEAQALQQAGVPPDRQEERAPVPSLRIGAKAAIGRREHQCNPALLIHCGGTRLPAPELLGDAMGWSHTPRVEPVPVGLPKYEGWPRPGPTPSWCLHLFALCHLHVKDAIALNAQVSAPTASDARALGEKDLEPVVQALRRLQMDGHLPTDPSTRLHFSCDELQAYLASEEGLGRAARTRPQWAKLLEAPTLLVVALRRGRRVAQLGPRSPDYLSGEAMYASLADLRSRRLAEMAAHVDGANRELDPELLNRAQRRRANYKESMRLKDATQHARMVHAHHARRRDAARRANIANRNFDERRYEASRDAYSAAIQQAEHLEALLEKADDKARGPLLGKLAEATRRAEQSAAQVAFASAKAEASLKRYKAPPPIGPTEKIPIELDPFMHDLVAVDQPYSYHGDMVEARSSTASQTYRDAGAPRSAASISHELSQAEHILHSLQKEPEALPRPGGPRPLDDAGSYTRPYKGPIVKEDWAGMTYGDAGGQEKAQVGPRHPLSRMPPFAHGALDAKEQRTYMKPRPHLRPTEEAGLNLDLRGPDYLVLDPGAQAWRTPPRVKWWMQMMGTMAQDLLETYPAAVITDKDGFYRVDYDQIDVDMMRLA